MGSSINPPTGLKVFEYLNKIILEWNEVPGAKGYNVYNTTSTNGGESGFIQINNTLIRDYNRIDNIIKDTSQEIQETETIETVTTTNIIEKTKIFKFEHLELNENVEQFYIIKAVGQDNLESRNSTIISGIPLLIDTSLVLPETRNRNTIIEDMIDTMFSRNEEIDLKPGQVLRDLVIDPASLEIESSYIIYEFLQISQSFITLNQFDDENGDRISDLVSESTKKQNLKSAFIIDSDEELQDIIDSSFDKLAVNSYTFRKPATFAKVNLKFYSGSKPTEDVEISLNSEVFTNEDEFGNIITFIVTEELIVPIDNIDAYFDKAKNKYIFSVNAICEIEGSIGNVSSGTIVNSSLDYQVINIEAATGGSDKESNADLSDRAILSQRALDVGTLSGYERTLKEQIGVEEVQVVDSGHSLMKRDYIKVINSKGKIEKDHFFGKVDLWVRGSNINTIVEKISFNFKEINEEIFSITDYTTNFKITSTNKNVSESNPIFKVNKIVRKRSGVKDAEYLLDNLIIENNGTTIEIDSNSLTNQSIGLQTGDSIFVDYTFRGTKPILLSQQPIRGIASVISNNIGIDGTNILDEGTHYEFVKDDDPLLTGRSSRAKNKIKIIYDSKSGKPSGIVENESEELILIDQEEFELKRKGIVLSSVVVTDFTQEITYVEKQDYNVAFNTTTQQTLIKRTQNSNIPNGTDINNKGALISYSYGEELVITYTTNSLINDLQKVIDESKHITADVLVKESPTIPIDIVVTVTIKSGYNDIKTKLRVLDNISKFINVLRNGQSVDRDDIIRIISGTEGIDRIILPLNKMTVADNAIIINEELSSPLWEPIGGTYDGNQEISELNRPGYWSTQNNVLKYSTLGSLSNPSIFWGLRENEESLELVTDEDSLKNIKGSFLITNNGALWINPKNVDIINIEIDGTNQNGYLPLNSLNPEENFYYVTYNVGKESGEKDILINEFEYITLNNIIINIAK